MKRKRTQKNPILQQKARAACAETPLIREPPPASKSMTFPCSQPQNLAFFPILAPDPEGFFLSGPGCGLGSFLAESVKKGSGKTGGSGNRAVVSGRTNAGGNLGDLGSLIGVSQPGPGSRRLRVLMGCPWGGTAPRLRSQPESYPVSHPISYHYPISYPTSQLPYKLVTL